jgi:hypothetical protein
MIEILEEFEEGRLEGEPDAMDEAELFRNGIKDAKPLYATLIQIRKYCAIWNLDGNEIQVGVEWFHYTPWFQEEFSRWLALANKTLEDTGRNRVGRGNNGIDDGAFLLSIPGKLNMSRLSKTIFGWEEDENHPDAMLLSVGETMSQ